MYKDHPYVFRADGDDREHQGAYVPGDMDIAQFGGNSNWCGPVWFPINFLLIEALREYHRFYEYFDGDTGRRLGASHQTGWTALVASLFDYQARSPESGVKPGV